jgi:hypothetical protein
MSRAESIELLNRLFVLIYRSLPMYLESAMPWVHQGDEDSATTLRNIIQDQKDLYRRIGETILDLGSSVDTGEFPMDYTGLHDLSLDYLLPYLVEEQRRLIGEAEGIAQQAAGLPDARRLAEEALGSARAHLESLESLHPQPAAKY